MTKQAIIRRIEAVGFISSAVGDMPLADREACSIAIMRELTDLLNHMVDQNGEFFEEIAMVATAVADAAKNCVIATTMRNFANIPKNQSLVEKYYGDLLIAGQLQEHPGMSTELGMA